MPEGKTAPEEISAFLRGGPPTLPQMFSLADAVIADSDRLVIAHCGRNEHFTFTGWFQRLGVLRCRSPSGLTAPQSLNEDTWRIRPGPGAVRQCLEFLGVLPRAARLRPAFHAEALRGQWRGAFFCDRERKVP
ncbi:DUF5988 family protein [Streptomyces sp. Ac-502]|uniref:DUF5988 family protein n=1 Tax=Streptomyces sp. Ac-502 TaxID=3342801 RepID=UPI0038629B31